MTGLEFIHSFIYLFMNDDDDDLKKHQKCFYGSLMMIIIRDFFLKFKFKKIQLMILYN